MARVAGLASASNDSGAAADPTMTGSLRMSPRDTSAMSRMTTVTLSGAPASRLWRTSLSATWRGPSLEASAACRSSFFTTPLRPSEQISQRSPGRVSRIQVSISGEASTSPSTRISTERRGWTIASSSVMRPLSTSRCTKVWSVETWVSSPSR